MFDLLTETEKKSVAREYALRLIAIVCFFVAVEIVFAAVGGVFSLRALRFSARSAPDETAHESIPATDTSAVQVVERTRARLALLAEHASAPFAQGLATFLAARPAGVRLTSFAAERGSEEEWTLVAQGVAATRDTLAAFERALRSRREFPAVSLPVESFAKGTQSPFTIRAIYRALPL